MRILGICGSLQASSGNLNLLKRAESLAPPNVEFVVFDGLRELPHFDPDLEKLGSPPPVAALRRAVSESQALLIASPEYGFSLPGSLKNAIDWLIGTGELERKVVAITAATNSAERGKGGLEALRVPLRAVRARLVGGEPIVRGPDADVSIERLLAALVAEAERPDPEAQTCEPKGPEP
jgi:NAD(P)H-dependent FMN reductase